MGELIMAKRHLVVIKNKEGKGETYPFEPVFI